MMVEAKFRAIRRKLVSIGLLGTLKAIMGHVLARLFRREQLLFYVDIPTYSLRPEQLGKDLMGKHIKSVEELTYKDVTSIRDYAGETYLQEVRRRLANNWSLFIAYMGDDLAGGGWGIDQNSEFKTKVVPLFENDIALIDFFTLPAFRGRNVYPFLLSFAIQHFRERNVMRAFGFTDEWNVSAIKGIKKSGFRHFINYEAYTFFGNEIVVWKRPLRRKASE